MMPLSGDGEASRLPNVSFYFRHCVAYLKVGAFRVLKKVLVFCFRCLAVLGVNERRATWTLILGAIVILLIGPAIGSFWLHPRHPLQGSGKASGSIASQLIVDSTLKHRRQADRLIVRSDELATGEGCDNTRYGAYFVTDDHGYMCPRPTLQRSIHDNPGCCPSPDITRIERYSCAACDDASGCCTNYETCVACCQSPDHAIMMEAIRRSGKHPVYHRARTMFEVCMFKCRTSSATTVHQNAYKSEHRFCYSASTPPRTLDHPGGPGTAPASEAFHDPAGTDARRRIPTIGSERGDPASGAHPEALDGAPLQAGTQASRHPPRQRESVGGGNNKGRGGTAGRAGAEPAKPAEQGWADQGLGGAHDGSAGHWKARRGVQVGTSAPRTMPSDDVHTDPFIDEAAYQRLVEVLSEESRRDTPADHPRPKMRG